MDEEVEGIFRPVHKMNHPQPTRTDNIQNHVHTKTALPTETRSIQLEVIGQSVNEC